MLKSPVYKSYVRPAIPSESKVWFLIGSEMGILQTQRSMVEVVSGVQIKDTIRAVDFMLMLGLNEAMDQLAMANSVHWYGHVLKRIFMS